MEVVFKFTDRAEYQKWLEETLIHEFCAKCEFTTRKPLGRPSAQVTFDKWLQIIKDLGVEEFSLRDLVEKGHNAKTVARALRTLVWGRRIKEIRYIGRLKLYSLENYCIKHDLNCPKCTSEGRCEYSDPDTHCNVCVVGEGTFDRTEPWVEG